MTDTASASSKTLEELEAEITCLVCQGHFREAKLLPCMHYYCKVCIEELAAKCGQGRSFPCPECRKHTTLLSGSAKELQGAFFVERMKDLYGKMSKGEGKVETVCEMCIGKATSFCRECAIFCCSACSKSHVSPTKQHHVLILEKEDGSSVDPVPMCPEHDDPMTVFCFTCESVVCRDCIILSHSGHNFNILKKCALEKRREVCNSLVPLRKIQSDIATADEKLSETEQKIDKRGEAVHESIREAFAQLKTLLDQREAELSSVATALVKRKKDVLASQRRKLQVTQTEIQSLVEYVEQNLENTNDKDIMTSSAELHSKVTDEVKRHHQISLEPAAAADIVCELPPLTILPEKMGNVSCQPIVVQTTGVCDVYQQASSMLYVGSFTEITVPELHSLADPSLSTVPKVTQTGSGVYKIAYSPNVRGRHDLTVKVDGTHVDGSPFRIFANIHPSFHREPVRTIEEFNQPMGITFDRNKQLVVTECGGKQVTILDRDGAKFRSLDSEDIRSPRGVAAGVDGSFFVTCNVTTGTDYSCLLKLSFFGRTINKISLDNPFCVRMIRSRLYVCDRGGVNIFDTDCNCVGTLEADQLTQPYDVAEGKDCIYVVGNATLGVIAKFSFDGCFEGFFQQNLPRPRCICVNLAGFVFVTLCSSVTSCVRVFEPTSGDTIASFGLREAGYLRSPVGIAVDEDGFIYVCDTQLKAIVVF